MSQLTNLSASLAYSGGGVYSSLTGTVSVTQVGTNLTARVQSIGFASAELIDLGTDIGTLGYILIKNLDATNFVDLGFSTFGGDIDASFARLRPGEFCIMPVSANTIYALADTAACDVAYVAVEL